MTSIDVPIRLETDAEERAVRLHNDSLVIDTLGPEGPFVLTDEMSRRIDEMVAETAPSHVIVKEIAQMTHRALIEGALPEFWKGWEESGVDVSSTTLGAFGDHPFTFDNAIRDFALWTSRFDALPEHFLKVLRSSDARRAKEKGKHGIILNFQDTTHIGNDLDNIDLFFDLGIRVIQLTYNQRNLVGDGCTERNPSGLSNFGLEVVRRLNERGILIDLSHCSEPTTLDAIDASDKPIAVTHSFCRSVFAHDRGKSDEVIRAVGEVEGYFGVLLVPFFITDDVEASLDHFIRHFDRAVELAGPERVGIGTDWGVELPPALVTLLNEEMRRFGFRAEHQVDFAAKTKGFHSWQQWPNITRALVARGYSDGEIKGFLGENFVRVFERAVG